MKRLSIQEVAMVPGSDSKDLLGLLSAALPGVRVSSLPEGEVPQQTIEHMYKPRESVFGAVARDMVSVGWSVFPQEQEGNRKPGTVNGEMIKWAEKYELAKRRPDAATLELWCAQCSHLNVAVVLGPASGHTFVIDIDVT